MNYQSEKILVIPRSAIITNNSWYGIKKIECDNYLEVIKAHQQFKPRSLMELDPHYKQIIPYLVFTHENKYFVMQRSATATEGRLKNKLTLGIGGHIRQEDMDTDSIIAWAEREFHEEISYTGNLVVEPVGIINDDTSAVGQVHLGFFFLLHADSADISIKSELQSGELMSLQECILLKDRMETWSQFIVDYLIHLKK